MFLESAADAKAKNTVCASGDPRRYKLMVEPAQRHGWAELATVRSLAVTAEVKEGETQKINFAFRKPDLRRGLAA